jgi:hypothetical protein
MTLSDNWDDLFGQVVPLCLGENLGIPLQFIKGIDTYAFLAMSEGSNYKSLIFERDRSQNEVLLPGDLAFGVLDIEGDGSLKALGRSA